MPETGFKVTQYSGKMTEYGNSANYTGKLDDLSEQPVKELIRKLLKIDVAETFDIAAWTQFNATPLKVCPTSGNSATSVDLSTTGAATSTTTISFAKTHVEPIVTVMKERGIPAYENGDYLGIARPSAYLKLKTDLEGIQFYTDTGLAQIKNGEIGRYRGMRFLEQTHIPAGGAVASRTAGVDTLGASAAAFDPQTGTAGAWNAGAGVADWMFFMGGDTVAEGVAIPEEIRGKIPDDYGRGRGIAWYALEGFGLSHPDAQNARILKWDSLN
jgi:N4-gp56 family major capsid protein